MDPVTCAALPRTSTAIPEPESLAVPTQERGVVKRRAGRVELGNEHVVPAAVLAAVDMRRGW